MLIISILCFFCEALSIGYLVVPLLASLSDLSCHPSLVEDDVVEVDVGGLSGSEVVRSVADRDDLVCSDVLELRKIARPEKHGGAFGLARSVVRISGSDVPGQ